MTQVRDIMRGWIRGQQHEAAFACALVPAAASLFLTVVCPSVSAASSGYGPPFHPAAPAGWRKDHNVICVTSAAVGLSGIAEKSQIAQR